MAHVKMLVKVSGTRDGVDWPDAGDTLEVPADEAEALVAAGIAEAAAPVNKASGPAKRAEKATAGPAEQR